ncbi:TonB-dependent receptor [Rapidithrix thailandica]|uniref:TonB-dependent receptor n=1 Tax=Rapidithrix thailandica TaxID=413964 RepID=A0AAW9S7C1_9BACT
MLRSILLFLYVSLGVCVSVYAQATGQVEGKVTTVEGEPLPYINIVVKKSLLGTSSGEDGRFIVKNIQPGTYTFIASGVGYDEQIKEVTVMAGQTTSLNFELYETEVSLQEVVISAGRSVESIDEVPSSISIIQPKELQEITQHTTNIADVLVNVPGMALSNNTTSSSGQTLRGRNMLILIDGIPQNTPLRTGGREINTIDPNAIERIEVIKGATAIYGNGADGGIVNYITKRPDRKKPFSSTTTLRNTGSLSGLANSSGVGVSQQFTGKREQFDYVVNGSFTQTGVMKDANGEVISPRYGLGESNIYNVLGKVGYDFNSDIRLDVMYNFYSSNQQTDYLAENGVYGEKPAIGVLGEAQGEPQGTRYNHNTQLNFSYRNILHNTDLNVNLYYQKFKTLYGFSDYFTAPGYEEGGQSVLKSEKQGLRLNFKTKLLASSTLHTDIVYGLDVLRDVTNQELVDGRPWTPDMDMRNIAPYAQLKAVFWDDLIFKGGLRFENINIDVPDYTTLYVKPYGGDAEQGGVKVKGDRLDYNALVFNLGLKYNKIPQFKPFVSYSQSFSVADVGRILRGMEDTDISFESEAVIANNYEVGANGSFGVFHYGASAYASTSELGSAYTAVNGVYKVLRNPELVYGVEVTLDANLHKNITLGGSYSYVEGKLDMDDDGDFFDSEDEYMTGRRIPPQKAIAYAKYQLGDKFTIKLQGIYSFERDKFDKNEAGKYERDKGIVNSFKIFNLYSSLKLTRATRLKLGVENLFNEDYYTPVSQWSVVNSSYVKGNGARYNLSLTVSI